MVVSLFGALLGFCLHKTDKYIGDISAGWGNNIIRYTVGVIGTYPVFAIFNRKFEGNARGFLSYFAAFTSFGAGVVLAWIVETLRSKNNGKSNTI